MMVRTEGIITQLVFEHALRIRMKAETASNQQSPPPSTPGSETRSFAEGITDNESEAESMAASGEGTLRESGASSTTTATSVAKGKHKAKASTDSETPPKPDKDKDKDTKKDNLIGKINNLVTTDLNNLVDGRDFLILCGWLHIDLY